MSSENESKKADVNDRLAQLMLRREQRALEQEEAQAESYARKNKMQQESDKAEAENLLKAQANCDHRKGTSGKVRNPVVDYNVYAHTFINSFTVITCNKCGMSWGQGTTKEILVDRDGSKKKNHTGLSFEDALAMTAQSTNQRSSAEIPMGSLDIRKGIVTATA